MRRYNQIVNKEHAFRVGVPLDGGVLPVRRFVIESGIHLMDYVDSKNTASAEICNDLCFSNEKCDGWHLLVGEKCSLYEDYAESLTTKPHPVRSSESIVGFSQRRAGYLRPPGQKGSAVSDSRDRVLYILHFHHSPQDLLSGYHYILDTLMTTCMPSFMDVVVVTPNAMPFWMD
eukprot:CAMPEP_0113320718 /NCGR_PEP_ID=MMETSP0010_2-20120614/14441_1 /TAXON_ID=216773 ORGANISM="Corethron hystrix, Strain 308" /NCGR_SAMPLE_ID=MMETSP0010_2 /ASSEMBLY_ACC=CAM_ASM_000155 /LENGTH=173 /DNA_ID=CAMNT_0000178609 /DNA_START=350 /DNA_END=868 /DNA_ORIENTATION=- /assembly_acc=CAM_ASM_000155